MLSNYVKRFELHIFFLISLLISCSIWIPEAAATLGYRDAIAATGYIMTPMPTFTDDILTWIIVVLVVVIAGPKHLSRKQKV